ncbi:unnamed protein product [Trypanosoma congolense IL3000]|uniref:WGS project CAEQ00000000 data, annotated contig 118 n=1 Tax=Trypanosoma congolense (strain IL3000) TaxID=1068625 RepID=F9W4J3_TRYCI|nr:unnamed protein product [Trypanosoma congolense IL3000]
MRAAWMFAHFAWPGTINGRRFLRPKVSLKILSRAAGSQRRRLRRERVRRRFRAAWVHGPGSGRRGSCPNRHESEAAAGGRSCSIRRTAPRLNQQSPQSSRGQGFPPIALKVQRVPLQSSWAEPRRGPSLPHASRKHGEPKSWRVKRREVCGAAHRRGKVDRGRECERHAGAQHRHLMASLSG